MLRVLAEPAHELAPQLARVGARVAQPRQPEGERMNAIDRVFGSSDEEPDDSTLGALDRALGSGPASDARPKIDIDLSSILKKNK